MSLFAEFTPKLFAELIDLLKANGFIQGIPMDFLLEVAKGNVLGHSGNHKFGHNHAVGTTEETIWPEGGNYVFAASAATWTISSDNANDTAAGTGARTVEVFNLDGSYDEDNNIFSLNGLTGVNVPNSLRNNRMIVRSSGSGGVNAGTIYLGEGAITAGRPATVYGMIEPGKNQTQQSFFTVPNGKVLLMEYFNVYVDTTKSFQGLLYVRPFGEVFQIKDEIHVHLAGDKTHYKPPRRFGAKSDIEVRGEVSATTALMAGVFGFVLVDDTLVDQAV